MKPLQRLQFDLGEQISRKEYLKRKRKNSKLLRKRSKITYILIAIFIALAIYIVVQVCIYRKYNNFKYTVGEGVGSQAIYSIYFVTEGYTYDPIYSVSTILSSGKNEESILPSSDIQQISVTQECLYGLRNGVICKIARESYQIEELVADNVEKYIVNNGYIFYITADEKRLKSYNLSTKETVAFDITQVQQILADDTNVYGITHDTSEKAIYKFDYIGQGKTKLTNNEWVSYAILDNGIIYFVNKSDSNKIYRVSSNGNDVTKIADIKTVADSGQVEEANGKKYMFIKDNKLYYINTDDEDALWCYDLKSGENKRIISASIEILQNIDNTVFYKIDKEMGVYLYNYDTSFMSLVTKRRVKEFVIDNYAQIPTDVKIDNNYNI